MIYYSTENLKTETLDKETRDRILSLSYEKFFKDSVDTENEISFLNKSIEQYNQDYIATAKILKEKFRTQSFEDGETSEKVKTSFFANIGNWFIRVWAAIVTIFEKIVAVIQSLIKSLLLYIKKHMLLKNSLFTRIGKDRNLSLSFNAPNEETKKRVAKVLNNKFSIGTIDVDGNKLYNFDDMFNTINQNPTLTEFIKTKIIVDNKKSAINTKNLEDLFTKLTVIDQHADEFGSEEKMATFSEAITTLTSQAVLFGETDGTDRISSAYGQSEEDTSSVLAYLKAGNIKAAANSIVFHSTDVKKETITLNEFLGLGTETYSETDAMSALDKLRDKLRDYEITSKVVIEKGGFCDIIAEILKRYSSAANNDKKTIKEIKDKIIKFMQSLDKTTEEGQKLTHKCKRFTNLIVRVQKIKNDFILLRQNVLGNVLTAYSSMDKALSMVLIPFDPNKIKESDKELDDMNKPEYVGGKNGIDPLSDYDEEGF